MVAVGTVTRKHRGFTLIELMLASALLMMVMFSGYYAYSLYSQKWQKRVDYFWQGTSLGIATDTINRMLSGAIPYVIEAETNQASNHKKMHFVGATDYVEFISASPIFSKQQALIRLQLLEDGNSKHLYYFEKPLANFVLINDKQLNAADEEFWQVSIPLIRNVQIFSFEYFGWHSFEQIVQYLNVEGDAFRNPVQPQWYSVHDPSLIRILPQQVNINIGLAETTLNFTANLPDNTEYILLLNARKDSD